MTKIQLISEILKLTIGLAFLVITPYAVKTYKATEEKAKIIIGSNNYNYAKDFIEGQMLLHPDLFLEENIVAFLDTLDNKFGDRLSKDTIRRIVDLVIAGVENVK